MAKEFLTIQELVQLMESRGLRTDDTTPAILRRESYYAVVNGYKDPFLDRDAMQSQPSDRYKVGTSFQNIYDLFSFDRELRALTFSYLTKAEAALKNSVVYAFCEKYREVDSYLERSNYVDAKDMLVPKTFRGNKAQLHSKNLAGLMRVMNGKLTDRSKMRPFVRHYMDAYGKVPLWVLQNDLTFGNISHFYQLQRRSVQNNACKIAAEISGCGRRLNPHDMLRMFDVLVGYRNICAHDERLYCAMSGEQNFPICSARLRRSCQKRSRTNLLLS